MSGHLWLNLWNSCGHIWNSSEKILQFPQSSEFNSQSQAGGTTRSLSSPLGRPSWANNTLVGIQQLLLHGLPTIGIGILWTTGDIWRHWHWSWKEAYEVWAWNGRTSRSRRIRSCLLQGRWFSELERITFPGWFLASKRVWSPECNKWLRVVTGTHGSLLLLATTCQSNPKKQDWTSGPIGLLWFAAIERSKIKFIASNMEKSAVVNVVHKNGKMTTVQLVMACKCLQQPLCI